jgi:D-aminopeptidase
MNRLLVAVSLLLPCTALSQEDPRPRARDVGIEVGVFAPGPFNAITDVDGVLVGHSTVREGDRIRTGITAIRPHPGSVYHDRVPAAMHVGNGYGKLLGVTQVRELGELETPILLTCTLCVWKAADALVGWMLEREGMADVRSLNAVVGETNDGGLNDIRARPISVGAGTGTQAFGWKGGIGTSSRILPESLGGFTLGVLVQSNFGGILTIGGAPVGQELERYSFREDVERGDGSAGAGSGSGALERTPPSAGATESDEGQGSIMIILATDAPLSDRNLQRLAARAIMGLARTGSFAGNGSGDYVIAFSTAESVRRPRDMAVRTVEELDNGEMSALFEAAVEATEESIYNSLFRARTVTGMGTTAEALPLGPTLSILRRYGVIQP